jgi:hypothetical protein
VTRSRAILGGTLVVGTLDALDAIVYFGLRNGSTPMRIFQSIAAGWVGRGTYQGGWRTVALGVATHYFVAFVIVLVYYLASAKIDVLRRRPILCGALYGIAAYLVMNRVVIPLSAIGPQRVVLGPLVNGLLIHALGVGIPAAFFAAAAPPRSLRPASPPPT